MDIQQEKEDDAEEPEKDYATLVKLGGRKDLLVHYENIKTSQEPVPYPWVEWFDHYPPPTPLTLPTIKIKGHKPQKDLLVWNVPDKSSPPPRRHRQSQKLPVIRQRKPTYPPPVIKHKTKKLPSLPSEPVNFSRLLSMDYQKEWIKNNEERLRDKDKHEQEKKEVQRLKLLEHTKKARQIAGIDKPKEEKQRFIMKRFLNVPPKLKLPQL